MRNMQVALDVMNNWALTNEMKFNAKNTKDIYVLEIQLLNDHHL